MRVEGVCDTMTYHFDATTGEAVFTRLESDQPGFIELRIPMLGQSPHVGMVDIATQILLDYDAWQAQQFKALGRPPKIQSSIHWKNG